MKYYSAIKSNEQRRHTTGKELSCVVLSERSQTQSCMLTDSIDWLIKTGSSYMASGLKQSSYSAFPVSGITDVHHCAYLNYFFTGTWTGIQGLGVC
jgi:hypothetical protein